MSKKRIIYADLLDAFILMQVGDVLKWDVDNLNSAGSVLRRMAKKRNMKIKTRSDPPGIPSGYGGPGRLTIELLEMEIKNESL